MRNDPQITIPKTDDAVIIKTNDSIVVGQAIEAKYYEQLGYELSFRINYTGFICNWAQWKDGGSLIFSGPKDVADKFLLQLAR